MGSQDKKNINQFTPQETFKIAKETRDFEIKLFWQRTNYFLLLNSAVAGAFLYFMKPTEDVVVLQIAFCVIGGFVCLAWIKVGLGSKYWQSHWEQVLVDLQKRFDLFEDDLFSDKKTDERVRRNLKMESCYDHCVLKKPSVSLWMHRTARFFLLIWIFAFFYTSCQLVV